MLCALGLEDQLVGVTHGCDYPPSVAKLPRVTSTGIPSDAGNAEIDRLVRERHAAGLPLYDLDERLLARLRPDLLVTQGLCDVCAIPDATARDLASCLPGSPAVVSLAPRTLVDVFANILELGQLTGREAQSLALVRELRGRVEQVRTRAEGMPVRPRVTLLEWLDPLYACGHWTPELVSLAGGTEGHAQPGARSRLLDWDQVLAWRPEILVIACCGLDLTETERHLGLVTVRPRYRDLPCVMQGRVYVVDGNAYFSRPGPRLVDSLELLAHLLDPIRFPGSPAWYSRMPGPPATGPVPA
jgi:iron complex transport system substrate-binding protein